VEEQMTVVYSSVLKKNTASKKALAQLREGELLLSTKEALDIGLITDIMGLEEIPIPKKKKEE
jgi:ATP-dependent protease ClpP protease subunit